jgi:hypothetical protein
MKHGFSTIALSLGFIASATAFNAAQAASLVAINSANQIGVFDSEKANKASFINISGFQSVGESFLGIDLRPSNNTIYGISTASKLYTVDAFTGAASFIAALTGYTVNTKLGYGIDFNPVADRSAAPSLRVVTSAGDNLAVNANNGAVTTQISLKTTAKGAQTNTVATGYTNVAYINSDPTQNTAPADTDLYYLNFEKNVQAVALAAFNDPTIITSEKGLGFDILSAGGFDIFSRNGKNTAYAAVNVKEDEYDKDDSKGKAKGKDKEENEIESFLLEIDLKTGKAKKLGEFDFDGYVTGLTSAPSPVPVPSAVWLLGSALLGFVSFKRKSV